MGNQITNSLDTRFGCVKNKPPVHPNLWPNYSTVGDTRAVTLITTTYDTMMAGIRAAVPGKRIGDIGYAMQLYATSRGFHVLPQFTGHGLGRRMHEEPSVPSVGRAGTGPVIPEGLVITIEPILVEKSPRVKVDVDGWTVRTADGGWAAQFEHAVMVSPQGAMILSEL